MVRGWAAFFLCLCGLFVSVGEAAETVVFQVFLNTVDQGEFVLIQTDDHDILFPQDGFQTLGFSAIPSEAHVVYENADYISLSALKQVRTKLDTGKATLFIVADPRLLQKQVKNLSEIKQERAPELARIPSAFLNYNIRYDRDNPSQYASISLPLELGLSAGELFGISTFSYSHTPTDDPFRRISSKITWDDIKASRQFVVGDISAVAGGLGGGGALGGISVSKNFSMKGGYFSPYTLLNFAGMLDTPSDVTLLINGLTVTKEHFGPGPFEFANVPATAGAGEGRVIIRDAFGRETEIPLSYYYVSSLLKPGLTEYGYQVGAKRKGDNQYQEMAATGFHRIGVTDSLSVGFRAEADQQRWNAGGTARFPVASFGDIDLSIAASRAPSQDNRAWGGSMTYGYGSPRFHLGAGVSGFERNYSNLSMEANSDKPRLRWQVGTGTGSKTLGSLSVSYQASDLHLGVDTKQVSIAYGKVFKKVSFRLSSGWSFGVTNTHELLFGLMAPFQNALGNYSVSADQALRKDQSTRTVFINKNAPQGVGIGGSMRATETSSDQTSNRYATEAQLNYKAVLGEGTADYQGREGGYRTSINWSGALVATHGGLYMSRPISDGFALVTIEDLKGVRVLSQNSVGAYTNKYGNAILPDIHSYVDNQVSIDDKDVPAEYALGAIQKRFSTPFRAGVHLTFEATRLQGFSGVFSVLEGAVKTPAEYWGLGMTIQGADIEMVVGKGGEFYLENLRPGKYPARLFTKGKECQFELEIPKSAELMVQMGEVVCGMP